MRWGIRKARKNGTTYTYKSGNTKTLEKQLAKQKAEGTDSARITQTKNAIKSMSKIDAQIQKYVENSNVGKLVVREILMGPFGNMGYTRLRSQGNTRLHSAVMSKYNYRL